MSFQANRQLWSTSFELIAQIDHVPAAQEFFAGTLRALRPELANLFEGEGASSAASDTVYHALLTGVLAQWLIDPGQGLTGCSRSRGEWGNNSSLAGVFYACIARLPRFS